MHIIMHTYYNILIHTIDPEKKYISQEGFLWLTGHEFTTRVQQPLLTEASYICRISGTSYRLNLQPPALCSCRVSQPLHKRIPHIISQPIDWVRPDSSNQNCKTIFLFAFILTNQKGSITTIQNIRSQPIRIVLFGWVRLCKFGFLICRKMDQLWTREGTFSIKISLPFVSAEHTFGFHGRQCFPSLQTVHLNKVSSLFASQIEDACQH